MIYDCFLFFNELELLEIRLNELNDVVDKFVLVEATKTFSNLDKPLYFQKNKNKFKKFLPKIIHVIVDDFRPAKIIKKQLNLKDFPEVLNKLDNWSKEIYQRNCIQNGLSNAKNDDVILIGDIDEIPNKESFSELKKFNGIKAFEQDLFYYYVNCLSEEKWIGTRAIHKIDITSPQEIRKSTDHCIIKNGGWHFSYLGGVDQIKSKIKSFSHQELNIEKYNSLERLIFNIENDLDIFERPIKFETLNGKIKLPKYLINNKKKFQHLFKNKKNTNSNTFSLRNEILKLRKTQQNLIYENDQLEQQNRLLQENNISLLHKLKTIQSSKIYKIWLNYNKFKKITGFNKFIISK